MIFDRSLLSDLPLGGAAVPGNVLWPAAQGGITISCRILTTSPEVADKAGLAVLNYPHTELVPSLSLALFASALQFARRHQVPILHDFAYAAIGSAASDAPLSLFSQPDAKSMGSGNPNTFSKTFNMAAGASASRSATPRLSRRLKKLHTHSYSTVFGVISGCGDRCAQPAS